MWDLSRLHIYDFLTEARSHIPSVICALTKTYEKGLKKYRHRVAYCKTSLSVGKHDLLKNPNSIIIECNDRVVVKRLEVKLLNLH